MTTPPKLSEVQAELHVQLALREQEYKSAVVQGQMTQAQADRSIACIRRAVAICMWLRGLTHPEETNAS